MTSLCTLTNTPPPPVPFSPYYKDMWMGALAPPFLVIVCWYPLTRACVQCRMIGKDVGHVVK